MVHEAVLPKLSSLKLDPERPLLVVDVDEVLVGLAAHLGEFAETKGYSLKLTGYQLDGALKRGDGSEASSEEFRDVFTEFFETQTRHQRLYPDAADVLNSIKLHADIVILTNVPPYAEADRIANLRDHSIEFPLVVNHGGKGQALKWLSARTRGVTAFIDDSPTQIASALEHAPEVHRLHFVGDDHLRGLLGPSPDAHHAPTNWREIETILDQILK